MSSASSPPPFVPNGLPPSLINALPRGGDYEEDGAESKHSSIPIPVVGAGTFVRDGHFSSEVVHNGSAKQFHDKVGALNIGLKEQYCNAQNISRHTVVVSGRRAALQAPPMKFIKVHGDPKFLKMILRVEAAGGEHWDPRTDAWRSILKLESIIKQKALTAYLRNSASEYSVFVDELGEQVWDLKDIPLGDGGSQRNIEFIRLEPEEVVIQSPFDSLRKETQDQYQPTLFVNIDPPVLKKGKTPPRCKARPIFTGVEEEVLLCAKNQRVMGWLPAWGSIKKMGKLETANRLTFSYEDLLEDNGGDTLPPLTVAPQLRFTVVFFPPKRAAPGLKPTGLVRIELSSAAAMICPEQSGFMAFPQPQDNPKLKALSTLSREAYFAWKKKFVKTFNQEGDPHPAAKKGGTKRKKAPKTPKKKGKKAAGASKKKPRAKKLKFVDDEAEEASSEEEEEEFELVDEHGDLAGFIAPEDEEEEDEEEDTIEVTSE